MPAETPQKLRVDKWLWHARLFKSRSLAGDICGSGALRIDGTKVTKPSQTVAPGNVLTFPKAGHVRIIRVEAIGHRRGPAEEAQTLYTDLDPPQARTDHSTTEPQAAEREAGAGRPTKRERREIDALRRGGS